MNIIITGGMTAGHIIPLIRLVKHLKLKYEFNVYYFGYYSFLEEKIANDNNIKFIGIKKEKSKIKTLLKSYDEIDDLIDFKIDKIISSGGFHSYPLLKYAKKHNIDYYLLEENAIFGYLNILFRRYAKIVYLSFDIKKKGKYRYKLNPSCFINKEKNPKIIYDFIFLGGSLGSDPLIKLGLKLYGLDVKVLIIAGRKKKNYEKYNNKNITIYDFVDAKKYMEISDIVVSRAGASTLFEAVKLNKKLIIIPSVKTKRNHQVLNAKYFSKNNLGIYVSKELDKMTLLNFKDYDFSSILKSQKDFLTNMEDDYDEIFK